MTSLRITEHHGAATRFPVHVQSRASRSEIVGLHGDALKVRLAAPPVDGAANAALVELLAAALGVPRRCVRVVSGARRVERLSRSTVSMWRTFVG